MLSRQWFYESRSSWCRALSKLGFHGKGHVLSSSGGQSSAALTESPDRFLQNPAISVLALCHLLVT